MSISAIPIATLVVFAILIQPLLYIGWKHGKSGILEWCALQVLCCIRIVGSTLEIQEEATGASNTATIIISNVGLSQLVLGLIGVLHEARVARNPRMKAKTEWIKVISYHGAVILSMVLVIVAVLNEISNKNPNPSTLRKIGIVCFVVSGIVLAAWTLLSFNQQKQTKMVAPAWDDATILLTSVLRVLPLLTVRDIYSILITFLSDPNFKSNTTAKVLMSIVPEMLLVATMVVAGIMTRNIASWKKSGQLQDSDSAPGEYMMANLGSY